MTPLSPPLRERSDCPKCGVISQSTGSLSGVCLRCAGQRVLAMISGEYSEADPSFDHEEIKRIVNADLPADTPRRIGPYEIIEEIGRGGMGRVFAARQIDLGRIVALKVIAENPATDGLEMRFLREVQTVAQLRHPGIVAVHDTGRGQGFVYFSMDYIVGGDLAQELRKRRYVPREAAVLVRKISVALEHAHRAGVLHRDLKPSNILLDGEEPQLADFGLAAQLEPGGDLTAQSGVLGTPHYLAPEALLRGSAALGVAGDIYAVGVILYELLAGRTPFAGAGPAELTTLLYNAEPPPPRLLNPAVPRDLETICLKCLERDPGRRYSTAGALEADLGHYLAGEPIKAQPPSAWYLFQKFARRHRVWFTAAAAVGVTLIAATAISASLAIRARQAERAAAGEAATVRAINEFLQNDLLSQASPNSEPNRDLKLRTVVDRAAQKVEGRFPDQPLVEAELQTTVGNIYGDLGDHASERKHYEKALALFRSTVGETDRRSLRVASHLAASLAELTQIKEGLALGERTLALEEKTLGPEHPDTIRTLLDLATITQAGGDFAAAEKYANRALASARKVEGPDHNDTRQALLFLASVLWSQDKLAEAERLNIEAVDAERRALGVEHPDTLTAMHNLASVYWAENKMAESEKLGLETLEIRRRVLGPEHPEFLRTQNNLATTYTDEGKYAEAIALHEHTLEVRRRLLGPEHTDTITAMLNLAMAHSKADELEPAAALLTPAVEVCRRILGPDHPYTLVGSFNLSDVWLRQNRLPEAQQLAETVVAARLRISGQENAYTLAAQEGLANIYMAEGKFTEAEAIFRNTFAVRNNKAPGGWRAATARAKLGLALLRENRLAEAEPMLVESATVIAAARAQIPIPSRRLITEAATHVVELYTALGQPEKAKAWETAAAAPAR